MNAQMVKSRQREPMHVTPRPASDLHLPIFGQTDFLATMRGYREQMGMSQAQVDAAAGRDGWNYIGKLEIDTRRAISDSTWDWLGALGLAMLIVKIQPHQIWKHKCPCCSAQIAPSSGT